MAQDGKSKGAPVQLDLANLEKAVDQATLGNYLQKGSEALATLESGKCRGNDFIGWLGLPEKSLAEVDRIAACASRLSRLGGPIVAVGIGGSYLGHRAVIDLCRRGSFERDPVLYAGNNVSGEYLESLLDHLGDRPFNIIPISKSGTTTEPAIAFRLLRQRLEKNVGAGEAAKRIVAVTDAKKGALKTLADAEKYESFVIPDDVGGRFSVFTPVGLVPIACAGVDVRALLEGASLAARELTGKDNQVVTYAAIRNAMFVSGKSVEVLANFDPRLHFVMEWWKQLFGESEGKEGKGLFPASVDLTTDLHSMGQLLQEGPRIMFETYLMFRNSGHKIAIPSTKDDLDKLNYLAGKPVETVNEAAYRATSKSHAGGKVPNLTIWLEDASARTAGYLLYFFEKACAISGIMLGINPFDQPGVEAYKKEMFAILGKPA